MREKQERRDKTRGKKGEREEGGEIRGREREEGGKERKEERGGREGEKREGERRGREREEGGREGERGRRRKREEGREKRERGRGKREGERQGGKKEGEREKRERGREKRERGREPGQFLGSYCADNSTCNPYLRHVYCNKETHKCECDALYPVKLGLRKGCAQSVSLNEQCFYTSSCQYSDPYSECVQIRHNAQCKCRAGFHSVTAHKPVRREFCSKE
ncbi:hypothetical protein WDU94_007525 [Cyamophila willieti]